MNLIEFMKNFPDEESRKRKWREIREKQGVIRPKCGSIDSDDSTSNVNLKDIVKGHHPQVIPKKEVGKVLPCVHIALSNAKRLLLDIHHAISPEHLQSYLNEFCYKFNQRYFGDRLFDRLLITSVTTKNEFRYRMR